MENKDLVEESNTIRAETFKSEDEVYEAAMNVKKLENNMMNPVLRIGDKAPNFNMMTTHGSMKLSDFKGKWLILFSHPGDFTPVCTTEFIAFSKMYPEFMKRDCNLLGLSIDSNPSHLDWVYNIYKNTGIQVPFPVIADRDMSIARKFNMIAPKASGTETVRCVFYIDPNQIIRAILTYPLTNGRNVGEILRLLDGLQTTDKEKVVTPANWFPGQPVVTPAPKDYKSLLEKMKNSMDYSCYDWFLCYKQTSVMPLTNNFMYEKKIEHMNKMNTMEINPMYDVEM